MNPAEIIFGAASNVIGSDKDLGAFVVKALAEAGYVITKQEPMTTGPEPVDIKAMSDDELAGYIADLEAQWKAVRGSDDDEDDEDYSCGGSPGEWITEELDAADAEVKRRALLDAAQEG